MASGARIYPYENHPLRTPANVAEHARLAERNKTTAYAVKGKSSLCTIVNLPDAFPIDYMHAVLEARSVITLSSIRFIYVP